MKDSGLSREAQFIIAHIFERQVECLKQLDQLGTVLNALANSVQGLVGLNDALDIKIQAISKRTGITVESVANSEDKTAFEPR